MVNLQKKILQLNERTFLPLGDQRIGALEQEVEKTKLQRGIFSQIEERLAATLAENGLRQLLEVEGRRFPRFSEWLEEAVAHRHWIHFYPTFVEDVQTHRAYFCKAKIMPDLEYGGLGVEAALLRSIPPEVSAPRLVRYCPAQGESLELLVIEAVGLAEGRQAPLGEWTPEHARQVSQQATLLESRLMAETSLLPGEPLIDWKEEWEAAASLLSPEFTAQAEAVGEDYPFFSSAVLTHGDVWPKNVLVSPPGASSRVWLIDWERGGAGYKGQDIGRFSWGVYDQRELWKAAVLEYVKGPEERLSLRFGTVLETMGMVRGWKEERRKIPKPEEDFRDDIDEIQRRGLSILKGIDEVLA